MLIVLHVIIALLGLASATYGLVAPSKRKFQTTYALTAATIASGTYLVWHLHAPILQSCMTGLAYLVAIAAATTVAQYRMRKAVVEQ